MARNQCEQRPTTLGMHALPFYVSLRYLVGLPCPELLDELEALRYGWAPEASA